MFNVLIGFSEAYNNAESSSSRRLILSVVASQIEYRLLSSFISRLTRYQYTDARTHAADYGAGALVIQQPRIVEGCHSTQVAHFVDFLLSPHISSDMPFGEKTLKLSNGTELHVPDTIRLLIPTRIIQQYYLFCQQMAADFKPLGSSTLFKIIEKCKASTRKAFQGLNNFVAEGGTSFQNLQKLIQSLPIDNAQKSEFESGLKRAKQYIKSDFKLHIARSSRCADHCIPFALSEQNSRFFLLSCDHEHDEICIECTNLRNIFFHIETAIRQHSSADVVDRLMFDFNECKETVLAWKAHLLRCVNQDLCRSHILLNLSVTSIYVNMDWAMKQVLISCSHFTTENDNL